MSFFAGSDPELLSLFLFLLCLAINALGVYFNWRVVYRLGIPVFHRTVYLKQVNIPLKHDYPAGYSGLLTEKMIFDFDSREAGFIQMREGIRGLKFVLGWFYIRDRRLDVHARFSLLGLMGILSLCFYYSRSMSFDDWSGPLGLVIVLLLLIWFAREILYMRAAVDELAELLKEGE